MVRFLQFVALVCGIAAGQTAPAAGSLTGKVVDATTGEGIRRATVLVLLEKMERDGPPAVYSTVSDNSGVYRFSALAPGIYSVHSEKTGFLPSGDENSARVEITAEKKAAAADLKLAKQAAISGRVIDSDGEPVEQASVQAIPVGRTRKGHYTGTTDDCGEFRIPRLPAGSYRILATKPASNFLTPNRPPVGEPVLVNGPTFFPSTLDEGSATNSPGLRSASAEPLRCG